MTDRDSPDSFFETVKITYLIFLRNRLATTYNDTGPKKLASFVAVLHSTVPNHVHSSFPTMGNMRFQKQPT